MSWSICAIWHLQYSWDDMKSLRLLFKCCWCRCGYNHLCSRCNDRPNLQCGQHVHHICRREVVNRIHPFRLRQFIKPYLVLPKSLFELFDQFGDCAHHPAGSIIFAQLAPLWIFFIVVLIFSILLIIGTCKITQSVSNNIQHLLEWFSGLSCCQFRLFSISHIILLLLKRCLYIFYSLPCHSGFSIHIILRPLHILIIAEKVCFLSFLRRQQHSAPNAPTLSTPKLVLPMISWWHCCSDWLVDLQYLSARSGDRFYFPALSIVLNVHFVVRRDVGCCKIWTTWRQAGSFMSRLVCLIHFSKEKSAFCLSLHSE